jgi:acetolactate synthase-1/2/3 large subunit
MRPPATSADGFQFEFDARPMVIFGIPEAADSAIVAALDARPRTRSSTFVPCTRPAGALSMADGYARVSGRPGVCLLASAQVSPNGATALLVDREGESSALVVVVDRDERSLAIDGQPYPWSGRGFEVERIGERLRGVQAPVQPAASDSACDAQLEAALAGSRPLLVLGAGARQALDDPRDPVASTARAQKLIEVVERHALPVVTSVRAKGIFPETHSMSLGCHGVSNEWFTRYARRGLTSLVAVGLRPGRGATAVREFGLNLGAPLVYSETGPGEIEPAQSGATRVFADPGTFLDEFLRCASRVLPARHADERRRALPDSVKRSERWSGGLERTSLCTPLKPQRVMSELQAILTHHAGCKAGVNLFCEVGNALGWLSEHLTLEPPHRFWCSARAGSAGWACGAVIGSKLADPERPALAVLGQHALFAHGEELSEAVRHRAGALWLVLNEDSRSLAPTSLPDAVARRALELGAHVHEVRLPGELVRRFDDALTAGAAHSHPQVLIVHVDGNEVPALPQSWRRFVEVGCAS